MAYNEPGPLGARLALRKKKFRETDPNTLEVNKPDLSTGGRPSPPNRPGTGTPVSASTLMRGNGLSNLNKGLDAVTPYISNVANSFRRAPRPKMGKMVSAVSISSPSLDNERNEIDRSVRGVDRSADLNLDANTAASVKAGNLIQGLRAKGASWANQAQLGIQAQNQSASLNANIEAINASKVDQYNNQQVEANIANQRNQSANISNAADKRIGQLAVKDQMNLDKKKFGILSQLYGSGVLDRLVKKVGNGSTNDALGLSNFANGGELEAGNSGEILKMGGKLKKLRRPNPTPPEMANQYMADGGPVPRYNFSGLGTTNKLDSAIYDNHFRGILNNDPFYLGQEAQMNKFGVPPTLSKDAYILGTNNANAMADARQQQKEMAGAVINNGLGSLQSIISGKAFGMRKAFGGPVDGGGGTFKTQAELDEANALANGISRRRGLLPAHAGTKIGDLKPTWEIDPSLANVKPKALPFNVPSYVQRSDIQTNNGSAWYTDPQSGDVVDIDLSVLNQSRFKISDEQKAMDLAKRSTATKRSGGYINGTIRRMAKGKLRKIY